MTDAARFSLVFWSRFFEWKSALLIVKPATLIGWHRQAFRLFWKWKSRPGRPRIPSDLRQLIGELVPDNPTWGEERVADEQWLKLGIKISPRTVRAYWPTDAPSRYPRVASQNWNTFVRNHAKALLACDFMIAVTARFRILYVFVVMEVGSRRIHHCNVTSHPTAEWTIQQLREAIPSDHKYRFLIHDRHATFSSELDTVVAALGVRAVKTPVQTPQANAFCERLIGTIRRECLDFMIPLNERHLRAFFVNGFRTTTKGAHTLAWGRQFRPWKWCLHRESIAIAWKPRSELSQPRFWADSIMNMGSNELRHSLI